jgi:hypothetical protein
LDYLNQEQAQLAVNVDFFDFPAQANGGTNLTGIAAAEGSVYSAFEASPTLSYALVPNAPGLNLDAANHAQIVRRGATATSLVCDGAAVTAYNTLSGSAQIITDGVKTIPDVPPKPGTNPPLHWYTDQVAARTAIGLSRDGGTLYVFTVDAAGGSQGMTVDEMADFLIAQYDVYNALNLDGGGSTTLAMADPLTHVGSVINAASGGPRAVGSNLAIFASPVPEPHPSPFTVTTIVRCRPRTSHSRQKTCCQVPSTGRPPATGRLSSGPNSVAWRCEWPLPSCQACSCP